VHVILPDGKTGWIAANALKKLEGTNPFASAATVVVTPNMPTSVPAGQSAAAAVKPVVGLPTESQQAQQITPPQATTASPSITVYSTADLTLIDKPFKGTVRARAIKGSAVLYLEEKENWARIRLADGRTGWVEKSFLSFAPLATTPAQAPTGEQKPADPDAVKPSSGTFSFASDVKIRETPRGGIIAAADKGAQVAVLEKNAGWSKVQLQNGEIGWVETANLLAGESSKSE
jgi:hypothetical protein